MAIADGRRASPQEFGADCRRRAARIALGAAMLPAGEDRAGFLHDEFSLMQAALHTAITPQRLADAAFEIYERGVRQLVGRVVTAGGTVVGRA